MPTPRLSTSVFRTRAASAITSDGEWIQGTVVGTQGTYGRTFTVLVNGTTVQAEATTDAPAKIGDVVWVSKTTRGWIMAGVA